MKKIAYVVLMLLIMLSATHSFAYISGKVAVKENLIYCPDQIICTEAKNLASCKSSSNTPEYWGHVTTPNGEEHLPPTKFKFTSVISDNHKWHGNVSQTFCMYSLANPMPGSYFSVYLWAKNEANLEMYDDKTTKWDLTTNVEPYCQSGDPRSCPLKRESGLVIINTDEGKGYKLNYSTNSTSTSFGADKKFTFIEYEDAINCWSSKQCRIDITMTNADLSTVSIGSVIVDMDDKMKVLEVLPITSSGMDIKKVDTFNAIEIKRSVPASVVPSIEIVNRLNLEIVVFANDISITKITGMNSGNLFSSRVADACSNTKECRIDLKTSSGGLIGTVVADVVNNMNILSVQPTRSSEIGVNIVNGNKIEVSYSSK